MASRCHFRFVVADRAGNVIQNATVYLYAVGTGTTTPSGTAVTGSMYTARTGGSTTTNPLTTNGQGEAECWFVTAQSVDVVVTDNSDACYYPSATGTTLSFTTFIEQSEVIPAPEDIGSGSGGGAPTDGDYLVGTANSSLSAEIVVGTTPGGELGGTWASPTVDATHSGSAHLTLGTSPSTQAFGDTAAGGSATDASKTDHKHAWPSLGTTAAAVGTSAGGAATTPSKSDHVHATGAGTPTTSAVGDAAATGAGPAAAMTNHVHGRESFGTTAAAVGTSAGGSATTPSKSDHVHATGAGTPTTQALGDSAATGSGPAAAMTDHKHAMPAAAVTTSGLTQTTARILGRTTAATGAIEEITVGSGLSLSAGSLTGTGASGGTPALVLSTSNVAGVAATFIRTDDQLALFDATAPTTQAFSDAAAAGTAAVAARRDHKHAWPALGTTATAVGTSAGGSATTPSKSDHVHATGAGSPVTQAFGDAATTGTGPAAAMTDHKHGMPAAPTTVATDTIWDTKGDLAAATGADAAVKVAVGADDTILMADAAQAAGLKWVASATPSTQALGDAAAVGTADTFTRGDHKHGMFANSAVLFGSLGDIVVAELASDFAFTTSSTALQNITGFLFGIGASATEVWLFEAFLLYSAVNATMDFKLGMTGPTAATAQWGSTGTPNNNMAGFGMPLTSAGPTAILAIGGTLSVGSGNVTAGGGIAGLVFGGGTAGNIQIQGAQNTSDAGQLTLKAGSVLRATRVHT